MRVLLLSLAVALAIAAVTVEPARACSCIPPDPWSFLKQADGAFVGRLVNRREAESGQAVLVFRVDRAVKGNLGDTIEVRTANNGAACGVETSVGQRIGLFLDRLDGAWVGTLCGQVSPEDLLAAALFPAPNGRGPVALLVGGRFGPARTIALDARGRTLAYGLGSGRALAFSVCPGGRIVAELVGRGLAPDTSYSVAIREYPTLRFVRAQRLRAAWVGPVRCLSATGDRLVVFAGSGPDLDRQARLVLLTPNNATTIWKGWAWSASLTDRVAYVTGVLGGGLLAVDLRTASVKKLATKIGGATGLVPDPNGRRFAGLAYTEGVGNPRLVVVDTRPRPVTVHELELPNATGVVVWLAGGRLALLQSPSALVYSPKLRVVSRFRWQGDGGTVVSRNAFGVLRNGGLVSAKLPSGPTRLVRRLPGDADVIDSATR